MSKETVADLKRQLERMSCGHLNAEWWCGTCLGCHREADVRDKSLVEAAKAMCLRCRAGNDPVCKAGNWTHDYNDYVSYCSAGNIHRLREVK
jgi:hypothetical protein